MTAVVSRVARVLGAATVTFVLVGTPEAAAVTPPPVDDSLLPAARPPAPPQRTEQSEQCVTAEEATGRGDQLADLDLRSVWPLTRGEGQTVAVIDTGVTRHRLLPHLIPGGDYVSGSDGTEDCDGHGTVVAGIIGATPDGPDAFSGVAPAATLIGIRQSSNRFRSVSDPSSAGFGDVDTLARAVRTAADLGATVINISSVACVSADAPLDDRTLGAALAYAVDAKNVVVVTAAGNVGGPGQCPEQNPDTDPARPGRPDWSAVKAVVSPAWYDEYVLTVGSVAPDGSPSAFSLAGPWVDVVAPGEHVVSLDPDGEGLIRAMPTAAGSAPLAGTSYAAPVVAGVVALLRSRSPELTARQVMQRIEDTARHPAGGWTPLLGHGVVDVLAAVTGGQPHPDRDHPPLPPTAPPQAPRRHDDRPVRLAMRGAAACLAAAAAVLAMTLSAGRLRRRTGIPHD